MVAQHRTTQADHGQRMIKSSSELSVGMKVILHQSNGAAKVEIVALDTVTLGQPAFRYRLPSGKVYSKTYGDAGMAEYAYPLRGWNQTYWVERVVEEAEQFERGQRVKFRVYRRGEGLEGSGAVVGYSIKDLSLVVVEADPDFTRHAVPFPAFYLALESDRLELLDE